VNAPLPYPQDLEKDESPSLNMREEILTEYFNAKLVFVSAQSYACPKVPCG
jgi:hypothetical protein